MGVSVLLHPQLLRLTLGRGPQHLRCREVTVLQVQAERAGAAHLLQGQVHAAVQLGHQLRILSVPTRPDNALSFGLRNYVHLRAGGRTHEGVARVVRHLKDRLVATAVDDLVQAAPDRGFTVVVVEHELKLTVVETRTHIHVTGRNFGAAGCDRLLRRQGLGEGALAAAEVAVARLSRGALGGCLSGCRGGLRVCDTQGCEHETGAQSQGGQATAEAGG